MVVDAAQVAIRVMPEESLCMCIVHLDTIRGGLSEMSFVDGRRDRLNFDRKLVQECKLREDLYLSYTETRT